MRRRVYGTGGGRARRAAVAGRNSPWRYGTIAGVKPVELDVHESPAIEALAEQVNRTGEERLLCRDGKVLARVLPPKPGPADGKRRRLRKTAAERRAAFLGSAGGWAHLDTDALVERIYESRRLSTKPPLEL